MTRTTYTRRVCQYGGYGVQIELNDARTTDTVFWCSRSNSYVIVSSADDYFGQWRTPLGDRVAVHSINGIGEIRWSIVPSAHLSEIEQTVIAHFALTPVDA